jgi:YesN/AraC family two-component response regulator
MILNHSVPAPIFKVLIVEDNLPFREILLEFLAERSSSINVEEAADGREAMEKVHSFCPDFIFMDIRLPDESGLDLMKRIKTEQPMTRVVMLTSFDYPEYRKTAAQFGADGFIVKGSVTFNEILKMVNSFIPACKN